MSLGGRSPAQVSAAVAVLLVAATPVWALVARSSDATASPPPGARSQPAIAIVSGPTVQTLETKIAVRTDARTHTRKATLVLGTARFTIRVTNTSAVELRSVAVTDPLSPRCSRSIGTLAAGASIAYLCSAANVGRNYTNTVTASGHGPAGARVLAGARAAATATATATVKVKPKTHRQHTLVLAFTG